MRLSALSIERPVLAAVATLLLMLFGLLSYSRLPVREYPDTTFPIVSVMTVYPSARRPTGGDGYHLGAGRCAQRRRGAPHVAFDQSRGFIDHRPRILADA
jgi:hypothetical protein